MSHRTAIALAAPAVLLLACCAFAAPAAGHPSGCAFPRTQPPAGDTGRVYAIPHGCVRLDVDRALLWTGQLSKLPSLRMTWYTHRAPG